MKNTLLILLLTLFTGTQAFAQCEAGEVEVEILVYTDDWGYEAYWELLPNGNNCGEDPIFIGGNDNVGCNGGGDQNQFPGGYGNNLTINEGPWCLEEGAQYDLIYVDDWGDGGVNFDVVVNGYTVESFNGLGIGATFTFTAAEPQEYDLSVFESNLYAYVAGGTFDIEAGLFNYGTEDVTSFDLNYAVDGGSPLVHSLNDVEFLSYENLSVEHSIPWDISEFGVYELAIWADNINGNEDQANENDTLYITVEAGPGISNIIDEYVDSPTGIVEIAGATEDVNLPTDLDFHPVLSNKELWVINKDTENTGGSTVTIYNAGEENQSEIWKRDGNAWHFMSLPTGIAFSENSNFANSPGVYDANHNGGDAFTGPALWSSDMSIYAEPSGGNGSHLDMTHASPYCQGIAYERDNAFWVFDGYSNDIVRNDFVDDHGPGNDYHADAIIRRYADDVVLKDTDDDVVSHLVLHEDEQWLYVVDHGNARVIRIDITTGEIGGTPEYPDYEGYAEYTMVTGYTQETVVPEGALEEPAGIDVIEDRMIVSEHESGDIIIYDISVIPAVELDRIETGFSSLQGIKIGPEGMIWGVDHDSHSVFMVLPEALSTEELAERDIKLYPNPVRDQLNIRNMEINSFIQVFDAQGKLLLSQNMNTEYGMLNISSLSSGVYTVKIKGDTSLTTRRFLKL